MSESQDLPRPRSGPGFVRLGSWPYRLEYAVATVVILLLLVGWRLAVLHALGPTEAGLSIFWFVWPDLVAFVPIGIAARSDRSWPRWGAAVYNVPHSLLTWAAVFGVWSALAHSVVWPLLGWAGHITMDRAVGYQLRASSPHP